MTEIINIPSDGWMLHGIVHVPLCPVGQRVGVVLFQGNLNPKFGAHRLFRQLAEALAEAGFYALRYDNRGTCDSPGVCNLDFLQRVTDGRSAIAFFRTHYGLDRVLAWGLCMGAAVAVHSAARPGRPEAKLDGLILCNILADPAQASMPEFGYRLVDPAALVRKMVTGEGLLRKLWQAPRKFHIYWENLPRLFATIVRRYLQPEPELDLLQVAISEVGELLAGYAAPSVLVFGEKDFYWSNFVRRVNPNDRLGLAQKRIPTQVKVVRDGDHTFASSEQTAEMIRYTLDWLEGFYGRPLFSPANSIGESHGVSAASVADGKR